MWHLLGFSCLFLLFFFIGFILFLLFWTANTEFLFPHSVYEGFLLSVENMWCSLASYKLHTAWITPAEERCITLVMTLSNVTNIFQYHELVKMKLVAVVSYGLWKACSFAQLVSHHNTPDPKVRKSKAKIKWKWVLAEKLTNFLFYTYWKKPQFGRCLFLKGCDPCFSTTVSCLSAAWADVQLTSILCSTVCLCLVNKPGTLSCVARPTSLSTTSVSNSASN